MSEPGASESAPRLTTADLDKTFLGEIKVQGVIAFGGFDDKFFYFPRAGFVTGESLDDKVAFNFEADKLSKLDRLADISIHYEPDGDVFKMNVFARVTEGE